MLQPNLQALQSTAARHGNSTSKVPDLPRWDSAEKDEKRCRALMHSYSTAGQLNANSNSSNSTDKSRWAGGKGEADVKRLYTLAELTATFQLPQSVRVVDGYDGPIEASKIPPDTILLVCLKKETNVVVAEDQYQMTFSIPRESSFMYSPLDPTYGVQGHVYSSVDEMLACNELPKVVHIDANTAFTLRLHSGDQLIFPVKKEPNTFGKSCLVCYDQKENKFTLPANQCGSFSTKPAEIKMYMNDCIRFIRKFPITVALCDVNNLMPANTSRCFFTLTATKTEESVVVKTKSKGEAAAAAKVIEVALDVPVKLQCLQIAQRSKADAKQVCDSYQNSAVENHWNTALTKSAYQLQHQLYKNVKVQSASPSKHLPSVSDAQQRPTSYEPLYENLVDYQKAPPPKSPNPQRLQAINDSSQGYQSRRRSQTTNESVRQSVAKPQRSQITDDSGHGYQLTPKLQKSQTNATNNNGQGLNQSRKSTSLPSEVKLSVKKDTHNVSHSKVTRNATSPQPPHDQLSLTVASLQPTRHVASTRPISQAASLQPTRKVTPPQPAHNVAPPQPPCAITRPQPTPVTALPQPTSNPQPTQPNSTHSSTTENEQSEEIYTMIPGELEPEEDYVDVVNPIPSQPTAKVQTQLLQQKQQQQQKHKQQQKEQNEHQRIQKLEASNEELRMQLTQVTTQLMQVTTQMTQLESSVAQILQLVVTRKPEDNIKQLSFLDADKVVAMLQAMGLSMYEHIFKEHKVDGQKMTRLDVKKLAQYGITNPQDQTKLTDVIKGTVSPLSYLLHQPASSSINDDTYDNYVRFTKS